MFYFDNGWLSFYNDEERNKERYSVRNIKREYLNF